MIRKQFWIVLVAGLLLYAGLVPADQDEENLRYYIELSTENQLLAAEFLIDRILQSSEQPVDPEKQEYLRQAREKCREGLRKYAYSISQDDVLLTDDWMRHFNPASPGDLTYPDISGSPLSLLAHLYIAYDSAEQAFARSQIASRQYSEAEERLIQILDESAELMKQALESAELAMGYKVHSIFGSRFFVEIPLEYESQSTSQRTPLSTARRLPDGTMQRVVLVNVVDAEHTIAPEEYAEARKTALMERFPDLSDYVLEYARGDGYEVRALYSYSYTWEGDKIKALVFSHKSGQRAYELNCLSLADHFDRAEFDRIIRSFLTL